MKKNILKIIALVLCLAILTVAFASCGKKTDGTSNNKTATENAANGDNSGNTEGGAEDSGESSGEAQSVAPPAEIKISGALLGSWSYVNGGGFSYTFYDNGTGVYTASDTSVNFTYTDDGSTVRIMHSDNVPIEYSFTVDGNRLKLTDTFGDTVDYINR